MTSPPESIRALTDEFTGLANLVAILDALGEPRTVPAVADAADVPESSTYRYIRLLDDVGLAEAVDMTWSDQVEAGDRGNRMTVWKRTTDDLTLHLH